MAISLTEDFVTLDELRANPDAVIARAHDTSRPLVVTVQGKPNVVILDAALFESRLKTLNFSQMVAKAEAEIRAGLDVPVDKAFRVPKRGKKVSR